MLSPPSQTPASAADFKYAKKIFVPATRIPRRYDYDSLSGQVAMPTYDQDQSYQASSSRSGRASNRSSSGLIPPPPPVSPSLLPRSMAADVPPPPPSITLIGGPEATGSGSDYSTHSATDNTYYSDSTHSKPTNSVTGHIISRAKTLEKDGRLRESQELLSKYVKTYPKDLALKEALTHVSCQRAKYYLRKDDYRQAARQARLGLLAEPENSIADQLLNQALRHQGIDPSNSFSRLNQGDLLVSQGKNDEAEVEYLASLKLKPSAEANTGLGNIAMRQGDLKSARDKFELAVQASPQSSIALRQLGIAAYKLKDMVGANADLTSALIQDPGDKLAGDTLIELWQRQVSSRPKDANAHLGLARAYQLSGNLKAAQSQYATVVNLDPDHPNLPAARHSFKLALARQEAVSDFQAAQTLDCQGAIREALGKANEAVELSPGDTGFRLYQAQLLEKIGDLEGSRTLYMELLKRDPKNVIAAQRVRVLGEQLGTSGPQTGLEATELSFSSPQKLAEGPALQTLPAAPGSKRQTPTRQIPTADPVQNMTGFLTSLRDLMLKQKEILKEDETKILTDIGAIKPSPRRTSIGSGSLSRSTSGSLADALADTSASSDSASSFTGTGLINSKDIAKLIGGGNSTSSDSQASPAASPGTDAASATATTDINSASSAMSLGSLAYAAGQAINSDQRLKNLSILAGQAAPSLLSRIPNLSTSSTAPITAPAITPVSTTSPTSQNDLPPLAPPIANRPQIPNNQNTNLNTYSQNTNSRLNDLEAQNRELLRKLSETRQQLLSLKSSTVNNTAPGQEQEVITKDVEAEIGSQKQSEIAPDSTTAPNQEVFEPAKIALRPSLPEIQKAKTSGQVSGQASGQVKLELIGVEADKKVIKLTVLLRNEQNQALKLPSSTKAMVRLAGLPDRPVSIKFPKKSLASGDSMNGLMKIPGTRLSPTADVFIPKLVVSENGARDVHLTVPISTLPAANQ